MIGCFNLVPPGILPLSIVAAFSVQSLLTMALCSTVGSVVGLARLNNGFIAAYRRALTTTSPRRLGVVAVLVCFVVEGLLFGVFVLEN